MLLHAARSGQNREPTATAGSEGRQLSRVKTGSDKCKDNKWGRKDWAEMFPPCPWTAVRKLGKCEAKALWKVIRQVTRVSCHL